MVLAHNNPLAPQLNTAINITFKIIVENPKIKFDREYNFIFPVPLDNALLNPIKIFEMINSINVTVYSYFIILITIPAITQKIAVPTIVYITVDVIILFLAFILSSESIKNLNIDSSISKVIIGNKNTDKVTKKS